MTLYISVEIIMNYHEEEVVYLTVYLCKLGCLGKLAFQASPNVYFCYLVIPPLDYSCTEKIL